MKAQSPVILGIETSCDDTACAMVDGQGRVLSTAVSSQMKAHRPFGGVVPEIASREHLRNWPAVSLETSTRAGLMLSEVDAVAATRGPGLVGCLLVGLSLGRAMAFALQRPFHGVHHLEGHLYSPFLSAEPGTPADEVPECFLGLVVSGGHTSILEVDRGRIRSLVETRDDAMGEVFDKVGKRLGLAYPQGPKVDRLAELAVDPVSAGGAFSFAVPKVKGEPGREPDLFFSFSGLKSQAQRAIEALERDGILGEERPAEVEGAWPTEVPQLLAGFRRAAVGQVIDRLDRLLCRRDFEVLAVSGGAAANRLLRYELTRWSRERSIDLRLVPLLYSGDNAAMIAFAALQRQLQGWEDDPRGTVVASRIPFRTCA